MPDESLRAWTELIAARSPVGRPDVLDVGAGTGMFAVAMARWAATRVAAIDASPAMLVHAGNHQNVHYLVADATALPLADARFDLALLSRVIHHLRDRRCAAAELKRVLRPGGAVVVRTTVRERLDSVAYQYWPELRALDSDRFPSQDEITADFTAARLRPTEVLSFAQPVWPSLRAWRDSVRLRPQSKFANLDDTQFRAGLQRLDRAVATAAGSDPVRERYDVLVFAA
ncbi:MAG: class I SAM-dependent methyltransferase [Actinobacteria bacterium]|nr:class I SAM-dependent methyltransferase [Actinomycetota bacterium]